MTAAPSHPTPPPGCAHTRVSSRPTRGPRNPMLIPASLVTTPLPSSAKSLLLPGVFFLLSPLPLRGHWQPRDVLGYVHSPWPFTACPPPPRPSSVRHTPASLPNICKHLGLERSNTAHSPPAPSDCLRQRPLPTRPAHRPAARTPWHHPCPVRARIPEPPQASSPQNSWPCPARPAHRAALHRAHPTLRQPEGALPLHRPPSGSHHCPPHRHGPERS